MDPSVNYDIPIFKTLPKILRNDNQKIDSNKENLRYIDITEIQDAEPFSNNKKYYFTLILFGIILGIFLFRYFCFFFFFKKD
jgi:hypothetical protein